VTDASSQNSAISKKSETKTMNKEIICFALSAMLFTLCVVAEAQQAKKVSRIGILSAQSSASSSTRIEAFRKSLVERGYIEGRNIAIEYRYADGQLERLPGLAAEVVGLKVDVIVAGGTPAARAAKEATRTIPIVMSGGESG
jgi:putative tryptophan/tyrosine transport system substrate-binding protein